MKRIRNYALWNNGCYKERALYNVFSDMEIRAKNAGIPMCIISC